MSSVDTQVVNLSVYRGIVTSSGSLCYLTSFGPVYTERRRQRCDNGDAPDQFGVATHFVETRRVLRNL